MNWMSLADHCHLVNLSSGPCAELLEEKCGNLFYHLKLHVPPLKKKNSALKTELFLASWCLAYSLRNPLLEMTI